MSSEAIPILEVGKYLDMEGVIYTPRQSVFIPREPEVFPDYGEGNCLYCGKEIPKFRRKYCSDNCGKLYRQAVYPYQVIHWSTFKEAIKKRDGHKCIECGRDTPCIVQRERKWKYKGQVEVTRWEVPFGLEVHHIIPLNKGGREFDPDNCVTLCYECHKVKHHKRACEPDGKSHQTSIGAWDE